MLIPLNDIRAARERVRHYLAPTPIVEAESYSDRLGARVMFKLELLQPTRSFKVRGALNAVSCLSEAQKAHGVVTASGGNHGLGLSYAAGRLGVKATVVLPETAPQVRAERIMMLGGDVIVHGNDWNAANQRASELVAAHGYTYVSPFDDADIIAGQGTIGLELIEQLPDVDVVVCSVGGGGLISGIASVFRHCRPNVRVVGVETLGADCLSQSLKAGELVELPAFTSIAGSLGTRRSTELPFSIIREAVEDIVTVSDKEAMRELLYTLNREKLLTEPAASCTMAALAAGRIPDIAGKTVAVVMCGGNITLDHVLGWLKDFDLGTNPDPVALDQVV